MKHRDIRLIAVLLSLIMFLSACYYFPVLPSGVIESQPTQEATDPRRTEPTTATEPVAPTQLTEIPESTEPTEPTEPIDPNDEALIRWQNRGQKDYLPDEKVELVPFSEMEYERPDLDSLFADFDALTEQAKDSDDAELLLERYYDLYSRYISFYSMDTLANIRYSLNTTDTYFKDEYNYCEEQTPNVEEKLEALNKAFAASPARDALEKAYFGDGYFLQFDDYEVYTNEEYLRLSQEEAALLSEYRDLTADIQVSYKGQTKSLDEWLETDNYTDYIGALQAYYEQYNPAIGDVYVRLIKVRRQLAAALDYDSYADYSFDVTYTRDYTPQEGEAFLKDIRKYLVPLLESASEDVSIQRLGFGASTEESVMEMVRSAAKNIGGTVWDAFRFMKAYELCDIAASSTKVEASFQTYIYDYEAPYVLVNASGSGSDYTTFSHEFGHFTDSYYNYGANEDLETAETFSQAMEFLALKYTDELTEKRSGDMIKLKLYDLLQTFVYQAAYASFEQSVYALEPEEITVEKINELYLQACKNYGVFEYGFDFYYSQSWIDVLHFFEVPYYIISYCVSAETSLQVYQLEKEKDGAGVAAYFRLLDRSYDAGVQTVMTDAELQSPFREGVLKETAQFFKTELNLK